MESALYLQDYFELVDMTYGKIKTEISMTDLAGPTSCASQGTG